MSEQESSGGKVTYTIREMFAEIKADLRNIDSKLEHKAERNVVENLDSRVRTMEVERKSEQEWGRELLKEYSVFKTEHAEMRTDISVMKGSKRDFAVWAGILINFVGVAAVVAKTFVH